METKKFEGRYGRKVQVDIGSHGVIVEVVDREERQRVYLYKEEMRDLVDWLKEVRTV